MDKMKCLRCGEEMQFLSNESIKLANVGTVIDNLLNLVSGGLKVDIYVCPKCRKLEFFLAQTEALDNETPKQTCPVCGTVHDFDYPKCPNCKHEYF